MNSSDKKKEKVKCSKCGKLLSRGYLKTHMTKVHQSDEDKAENYTVDNLDDVFADEEFDDSEFLRDLEKVKIGEKTPSKRNQPELAIQKKLEKKFNGGHQSTPAGIIDIISNEGGGVIVEIKEWKNYKAAIGQLFCYGYYYPNHMKQIHFFGKPPSDDLKVVILTICASLRIAVSYEKY